MNLEVLESLELKEGSHADWNAGACLMEAVAFVAGEPWSDHPACASELLGSYGRSLNDNMPHALRQELKPLIPMLVGSRGDEKTEELRSVILADWYIREHLPKVLRDAAGYFTDMADLQRGVQATPGTEPADEANADAYRYTRYARAIDQALSRASRGPGGAMGDPVAYAVEHDFADGGERWIPVGVFFGREEAEVDAYADDRGPNALPARVVPLYRSAKEGA